VLTSSVGETQSVSDVLLAMIDRETAPVFVKKRSKTAIERILGSMPKMLSGIPLDPSEHVKSFLSVMRSIKGFGKESKKAKQIATDRQIDAWVREEGHRVPERCKPCVYAFIQRILRYSEEELVQIDKNALVNLVALMELIKRSSEESVPKAA
jgi:hypothetical protein